LKPQILKKKDVTSGFQAQQILESPVGSISNLPEKEFFSWPKEPREECGMDTPESP